MCPLHPLLPSLPRAVLFVPKTVPHEFYDKYYEKGSKGALKVCVWGGEGGAWAGPV